MWLLGFTMALWYTTARREIRKLASSFQRWLWQSCKGKTLLGFTSSSPTTPINIFFSGLLWKVQSTFKIFLKTMKTRWTKVRWVFLTFPILCLWSKRLKSINSMDAAHTIFKCSIHSHVSTHQLWNISVVKQLSSWHLASGMKQQRK